jgi:hypothetical protein
MVKVQKYIQPELRFRALLTEDGTVASELVVAGH